MRKLAGLAALAAAVLASSAYAGLTHQYTFNNSTNAAIDAVGGANGEVKGTATTDGSSAQLPGGAAGSTGPYVNLPNNVMPTGSTASFEIWVTVGTRPTGYNYWMDFGTSSKGEDPTGSYTGTSTEWGLKATGDGGNPVLYPANGNNEDTFVMAGAGEHHLLLTWDSSGAGTAKIYVDGNTTPAKIDTTAGDIVPGNSSGLDVFNNLWLGRSNYSNDPYFAGSINEFRIYDTLLDPAIYAADQASGAQDVVPEPASLSLLGLGVLGMLRRRR